MGAAKLLYGWNAAAGEWLPMLVDATGRLRVGLAGVALGDLGDVNLVGLADQDLIWWNAVAGEWQNVPPATMAGAINLDDLGDVNAPAPAADEVLTWDAVALEWVSLPVAAGGGYNYATVNSQSTDVPNNSYVVFARIHVPAGFQMTVYNAGIYPHGTANFIVEVYDNTTPVSVYSTTADYVDNAAGLAAVAAGKEVIIRIKNTSGGTITEAHAFVTFAIEAP